MPTDLGHTNSIDVLRDQISLDGRRVLDVGCGGMAFTRMLVAAGARVLGIDPDPRQAERNRSAERTEHLEFIEAGAEALPVEDASVDGIVFSFSLHHVPADLYPIVFDEVGRVLRPDGFLCVIEPTNGPLDEVVRFFHDEDREQAAAQQALVDLAVPMFESFREFTYHSTIKFDSFESFVERYGGKTFNSGYSRADVDRPEVRAMFERLGGSTLQFPTPKRMMFLERLAVGS